MASEFGFSCATAIVLLHFGPAGGHDLFDGWIGMRLTASCGEPEIWLPSLVFSCATAFVVLQFGPAGGHDIFGGWIGMLLTVILAGCRFEELSVL